MSRLLTLPTPLSSSSISLGQLVTDPVHAENVSFKPSSEPACEEPSIQSNFESTITHDAHGLFVYSKSGSRCATKDSQIILKAEQSSLSSVAQPRTAFNTLRNDEAAQSFLRTSASHHQQLYYVTGLQILKNPSFQRAGSEGRIAEAPAEIRLPMHVRRVDSAFGLDKPKSATETNNETVLAVELMKVRCRVGPANEPHTVEDIGYDWSYHALDGSDLQLSIGLGEKLQADELRALAGMEEEKEQSRGRGWDERYEDEDEGFGGF